MNTFTLRSSRMMMDLTILEVSKMLGVTTTTWKNYESGKTKIPAVLFLKYCELVKLDPKNFELN